MSIAERAYASKTSNEEKAVELVRRRNEIVKNIDNIQTHKELMSISRDINSLIDEGYDSETDVTVLKSKLYKKLIELKEVCSKRCEQLKDKEDKIKCETYPESADVLAELHTKADNIMLRLLSQFTRDTTNNKMIISNALRTKDRATGIALLRLAASPIISQYFTPRSKQDALDMSKSDGEKSWQVDHDKRLRDVGRERGSAVLENFFLSQAENVIKPKNESYFGN